MIEKTYVYRMHASYDYACRKLHYPLKLINYIVRYYRFQASKMWRTLRQSPFTLNNVYYNLTVKEIIIDLV